MQTPKPVIYILGDNGEALNTLFYCSTQCRADDAKMSLYPGPAEWPSTLGENSEYIPGTKCERCGVEL